ncbi:MAG: hypothetical protein ACERKK_01555 [Poseidonibacter sp.]|uniref:hypothetical protein n=1 Tax=Poseidonibacter sp. TaxID=2321188 RepID=UPI00359D9099
MIDGKVSGNGVTSFLNILLGMYTALRMKLKNKSSILLTLLSLYIVIEGYGRGSILFVLILLIINLVFLFYSVNRKWKLFYIVLLCFVIIMFSPYIYDFLMSTKLSQGIQNPRIYIAQEYISKLHAWNLFFGVSYENTVIATLYDNNPHISYIRTHHIFGLFYLLGLLYVVLKQTFYVVFNRSLINWIILLIIYNILMRAVSEPLLFPSLFDSFFLVILFSITKKSTKENR